MWTWVPMQCHFQWSIKSKCHIIWTLFPSTKDNQSSMFPQFFLHHITSFIPGQKSYNHEGGVIHAEFSISWEEWYALFLPSMWSQHDHRVKECDSEWVSQHQMEGKKHMWKSIDEEWRRKKGERILLSGQSDWLSWITTMRVSNMGRCVSNHAYQSTIHIQSTFLSLQNL